MRRASKFGGIAITTIAILSVGACAHGLDAPTSTAVCDKFGCDAPPGACTPGTRSCTDGQASWCRPDGTLDTYACDPEQGLVCNPGGCDGACSHEQLGQSHIRCDYLPTVTPNPVWHGFDFAVAVANAGESTASARVLRQGAVVAEVMVAPQSLQTIKLPWVDDLKRGEFSPTGQILDATGETRLVTGGSYRLLTDEPVTVYQLNSLEYTLGAKRPGCPQATDGSGGCYSYSNDTSLLLPVNALGRTYIAMAWDSTPLQPAQNGLPETDSAGFISVTAASDNTTVTLAAADAVSPGGGLDGNGAGTVTLNAGDVLEIIAAPGVPEHVLGASPIFGPDLSGSVVHASKPVSVIAGHRCASIPTPSTGYCDHVEEAMLPSVALGRDHVVAAPGGPTPGLWPYTLRIAASLGPVNVHFDPAVSPDVMLAPGTKPFELIGLRKDVRVTADGPIVVAQYMQGSTTSTADGKMSPEGDPSESMVVPIEQFRKTSVFLAPTSYDGNLVSIVAKTGTSVILDGMTVDATDFLPVGQGDYSVARQKLDNRGAHTVLSDSPVGLTVCGYGKYTSYMNPASMDLVPINDEPR